MCVIPKGIPDDEKGNIVHGGIGQNGITLRLHHITVCYDDLFAVKLFLIPVWVRDQ